MARKNHEIYDRYGRRIPDEGENMILPDGARMHVPLLFRGSDGLSDVQRAIMADKAARRFDDSQARHGVGPVYADRSVAMQVYEDEKRAAQEAWRTPTEDARRKRQGV